MSCTRGAMLLPVSSALPCGLCRLAALHTGERDIAASSAPLGLDSLRESPALTTARQAFFLLLKRLRGRIEQAKHLIHRLARIRITLRKPPLAIVRAAAAVPPPVHALTRMLM